LTSTYFESDPPFEEDDKRPFRCSRDHRLDCVQVVVALIVTPEGLPMRPRCRRPAVADEGVSGNASMLFSQDAR
jgi:hypothetical protein